VRPARKRELVNGVRSDWGVSIRRACRVLEMDTSTYHYKSRRREQAGIEARIREICETRVRYGYRRVHVLLRREGWEINMKRTHRIYNELGLQLRNKTPRRRMKAKLKEGRCAASFADLHQKATRIAADFLRHLSAALRYKICTVQCPGARRKSEIWLTSLCAEIDVEHRLTSQGSPGSMVRLKE